MRTKALVLAFVPSVALSAIAAAQAPTGARVLQPFTALPPLASAPDPAGGMFSLGEPTGDRGDLHGRYASMPLRLSLTRDIFPQASLFPNCASREDASGNTVHGMPIHRYTMLALGPHLVLSGFSQTACPVDSGMGGAITYAVPIDKRLWLVAGAGIYSVPAHDTLRARTRTDLRVDIVTKTEGGRVFNVGIGKRGVSFGGTW